MRKKREVVELNGVKVGNGYPCYFVAEIAGNFADFNEAKILIDSAIKSGCNAVKFQTLRAETITTKDNVFALETVKGRKQYDVFKEYELPVRLQKKIVDYARSKKITIFSAPSHMSDIETFDKIGIDIYKIGSDLAIHIPLLKYLAKRNKPIILSTGMCTLKEVHDSVKAMIEEGNRKIIVMHCVSDYPCKINEVNLKTIITLRREFDFPVGYSDHTIGPEMSLAAITLGANVIERHFYHQKCKKGADSKLSANQAEMEYIIKTCRKIEQAMGGGVKEPTPSERKHMMTNRISIVVLKDVPKGAKITREMIDIRRPGTGIAPKYWDFIIGKRTTKNIKKEQPLKWGDLEVNPKNDD